VTYNLLLNTQIENTFITKKISKVEFFFLFGTCVGNNSFSIPHKILSYSFSHGGNPKIIFISRASPTYEDVYMPQNKQFVVHKNYTGFTN